MPIEIRELIIRAVASGADDDAEADAPPQASDPAMSQDEIVQECVRQVLKILEKQKER